MKILYPILLLFVNLSTVSAGDKQILSREAWSQPKQVESVLQIPAIKNILTEINGSPNSQLVIFYPGGDEGTLWAHELKAWLVSLGLPSSQIDLRPGSSESSALEMQVELPLSGNLRHNEQILGVK